MNVYDFDNTICKDDTESDWFKFTFKRHPMNWLCSPYYLLMTIIYKLHIIDIGEYRQRAYLTLKFVKHLDKEIEIFWQKRKKKIMPWYLSQHKEDDLVISATPRIFLLPIFKELHIKNFICSELDLKKRRWIGKTCYGEEKVRRFLLNYKASDIDAFYTDSLSDAPMMLIAKKAYLVKNGKITKWENKN